jgi:hypothetical protein
LSSKKRIIDVEEWDAWYHERIKNLRPYDIYDTGYVDALDVADDWMGVQPILDIDTGLSGQYKWERDVAINQLEQLGIGLGQKIDGVYLTKEEYERLAEYKYRYEQLMR